MAVAKRSRKEQRVRGSAAAFGACDHGLGRPHACGESSLGEPGSAPVGAERHAKRVMRHGASIAYLR